MSLSQAQLIEVEAQAWRYLAGQLSETEEALFENRMVADPDIAQQVDVTARLRAGLLQLQSTSRLEMPLDQAPSTWRRSRGYALAATIVLAVAGSFAYLKRSEPTAILAASPKLLQPLPGASNLVSGTYVVTEVRGGTLPSISLPQPRTLLQLEIYPNRPIATGRYQVELRSEADPKRPLAHIELPTADQIKVVVFLNSSRLVAGRYTLQLEANDGARSVYELSFTD